MTLSKEDQILIKNVRLLEGYTAGKLIEEVRVNNWYKWSLNTLVERMGEANVQAVIDF